MPSCPGAAAVAQRPHPIRAAPGLPQPRGALSACRTIAGDRPQLVAPPSTSNGAPPAAGPSVCVPEDFVLAPGELSHVDRGPAGCATNMWRFEADGYLREILKARVYDVAVQTPLEEARKLSDALGSTILLKREDLQPVFSFKLRGAYNKMAKLPAEARARGVITSSAGNHAQGVALAASRMGCTAIICMPVNTPEIKVANVRKLGGQVVLVGESYQEAQAAAVARAAEEGLAFIPPYDDPFTIAGQGTIGDEILRQASDPDKIDAIFVPIGGGGLIAGIAAYTKALNPNIQIIGVEPTGANAMAISLARGARVTLSRVDAFADGVAVKQVGQETFRLCRELVDGVVLVDNSAVSAAIKDVFNETRSILEPAGALAVAGAKAWLKRRGLKGATVVAITSGANMNFERLRLVAELANVGGRTEATLATTIPERPGAFKEFIATALCSDADISVTEFKYRYSAGSTAQVLWGVGIRSPDQLTALLERLNGAGMRSTDLSGLEVAQVHLRHLAGGRARSYTGCIEHEKIIQVVFPEQPGALRRFLDVVSPAWNVTLFHYRNSGNRESSVLLGVQVPPYDEANFADALLSLRGEGEGFAYSELQGAVREVFDQFIQ
ncbi:Threonine dehydratase biosynthetic, chloroplastic [Tetrabaena socialis]|uniref:Threonine dehydratase n=1 Tax=Tetrabaena socialis TaxID=47790 RepID=A0A2J8A487_9CHLO|nr:Threonine dehydratase biosynthetic, chloroplastic [Tetrabaena socialis]|eukprot:PNH07340.1 Threonine dehydratase biosynthetic, chloroplastic [Tetrabaena socialis]